MAEACIIDEIEISPNGENGTKLVKDICDTKDDSGNDFSEDEDSDFQD